MDDFGYVAGLFVAEGNYASATCTRFTINADRVDLIEKIEKAAGHLGATVSFHKKNQSHCYSVNVNGASFRGMIEQFVAGETSHKKHFSRTCWQQSLSFMGSLLAGYLDGDGSWTERQGRAPFWRIGFSGKNYSLAEDLQAICNLLGKRCSIKRGTSKCNGKSFPTFVGWIKEARETYNQKHLEEIVSISLEAKPATVYDIQVDGDHLFCLASGIQTHNSFVGAVILAANASNYFAVEHQEIDGVDGYRC